MAGADAEDDAAARQRVERRERLGGLERVAVRRDPDVGQQAHERVAAASKPSVATASYQVVDIAAACERGTQTWSHTAT